MEIITIVLALSALMFFAYRGYSVIIFAPICALFPVLFDKGYSFLLPCYSDIFLSKMSEFIKLYFPVFLLGAVFGKLIELSNTATSLSELIVRFLGPQRAILAIVLSCAILTYGGVSLFVVAFAVYPIAASTFKELNLPKRLIPGTIALGAFTFTMDSLPGTPQIQNVIPTTFFGTTIYAAPFLGCAGALFVFGFGLAYLQNCVKRAKQRSEGYGFSEDLKATPNGAVIPNPFFACVPLVLVAIVNKVSTFTIPIVYENSIYLKDLKVSTYLGVWSIELALLVGIAATFAINYSAIASKLKGGLNQAVGGALLAIMNTASEYGFGAIISSLAGFAIIKTAIAKTFTNPLLNEAVSVNILAGITGSASGGMSIALASLGSQYIEAAKAYSINPEILHRIASMASGGMDTLPHNGAVITLLAITGLTHKESYKDIFVITVIKTIAVFFVIGLHLLTGLV